MLRAAGVSGLLLGAACSGGAAGSADGGLAPDERSLTPRQLVGKRLFEDATLSEPPGQACASCHDPRHAFAGNAGSPIAAVAQGSRTGQLGGRNVPTAMYASFSPAFGFLTERGEGPDPEVELVPSGGQFWDGRASSLAEQAKGPFLNPREMNNPSAAAVVAKVAAASYAELFRPVYGPAALDDADAAYGSIADAIAAFEETPRFHPFASKFDDVLQGNDQFTET